MEDAAQEDPPAPDHYQPIQADKTTRGALTPGQDAHQAR